MPRYRVGIDIGGTFTDFFVIEDGARSARILKTASNPTNPEQSVFDGLQHLFGAGQIKPDEIQYFTHGTTLAVNTIIQRRGLRTALLVTEGFRDILNIGRHRIPDVFNFFTNVPDPLVPRALTFEIPERSLADGTVYRAVDTASIAKTRRAANRSWCGGRGDLLHAQLPQPGERNRCAGRPRCRVARASRVAFERDLAADARIRAGAGGGDERVCRAPHAALLQGARSRGQGARRAGPRALDQVERRHHARVRGGRAAGGDPAVWPGVGGDRRRLRRGRGGMHPARSPSTWAAPAPTSR